MYLALLRSVYAKFKVVYSFLFTQSILRLCRESFRGPLQVDAPNHFLVRSIVLAFFT